MIFVTRDVTYALELTLSTLTLTIKATQKEATWFCELLWLWICLELIQSESIFRMRRFFYFLLPSVMDSAAGTW